MEGLCWGISCTGWAAESHYTPLFHPVPPNPSQLPPSPRTGSSHPAHKPHTLGCNRSPLPAAGQLGSSTPSQLPGC